MTFRGSPSLSTFLSAVSSGGMERGRRGGRPQNQTTHVSVGDVYGKVEEVAPLWSLYCRRGKTKRRRLKKRWVTSDLLCYTYMYMLLKFSLMLIGWCFSRSLWFFSPQFSPFPLSWKGLNTCILHLVSCTYYTYVVQWTSVMYMDTLATRICALKVDVVGI